MRRAHDEYNWRPEIHIELNGPSTGRGNGATEASRASLSSEASGLLFVVAKSQARKTRVIAPAIYPRIRFPDNSLPGQFQIAQEAV